MEKAITANFGGRVPESEAWCVAWPPSVSCRRVQGYTPSSSYLSGRPGTDAREWTLSEMMMMMVMMMICKSPTTRLKALIKHNVAHIMCFEMKNVTGNLILSTMWVTISPTDHAGKIEDRGFFVSMRHRLSFTHWRKLPRVSFLSRQKYGCRDKHVFVATTILLSRQKLHLWLLPPMIVDWCFCLMRTLSHCFLCVAIWSEVTRPLRGCQKPSTSRISPQRS